MDEDSAQATDRLYLVGVGVVVFLEAVDEARHDLLARVLTVAHHHDQPLVLATRQQTQRHCYVNTQHRPVSSKLRCAEHKRITLALYHQLVSD